MTTTVRTAPTKRTGMTSTRRTSLVAGIFYLITFVSIPTLGLYGTAKTDTNWILGSGTENGVLIGVILEVIVALAGIGSAVTLFPVMKRQNEGLALGLVATRVLEAGVIFTGAMSLLTLLHLRTTLGATGGDSASLVTTGASLVSNYNGTMLLGQTLMPCMNALLLGTLMYRSRLVPRAIPMMGLIGAPLLLAALVAVLFGAVEQVSTWTGLATIPIAAWEFSLGIYLTFKGFKPSPITAAIDAAHDSADRVALAS